VIPECGAKGLFIRDIFHIRLDEGERLLTRRLAAEFDVNLLPPKQDVPEDEGKSACDLNIPCPEGGIKVLATFAPFSKAIAAKYVTDGVGGDGKTHPLKVSCYHDAFFKRKKLRERENCSETPGHDNTKGRLKAYRGHSLWLDGP
jgi:hypothetical protein